MFLTIHYWNTGIGRGSREGARGLQENGAPQTFRQRNDLEHRSDRDNGTAEHRTQRCADHRERLCSQGESWSSRSRGLPRQVQFLNFQYNELLIDLWEDIDNEILSKSMIMMSI